MLSRAADIGPEYGKPTHTRDIWAIGCILYELLTGTRAFEDEEVHHTCVPCCAARRTGTGFHHMRLCSFVSWSRDFEQGLPATVT